MTCFEMHSWKTIIICDTFMKSNHILNVFHNILGLRGVVLTHTTFTPKMHCVRTLSPTKNHGLNFGPLSKTNLCLLSMSKIEIHAHDLT
jgi:hypothetical protein